MNKQRSINPMPQQPPTTVLTRYGWLLGVLGLTIFMLAIFTSVTLANSDVRQLSGNESIQIACEGREFDIVRVSRVEVSLTCGPANEAEPPVPPMPDPDPNPPVEPIQPDPPAPNPGIADFYVAPNGDDNNPGTFDQPFRTIQHAVNRAQAGQTIVVRDGTYREQVRMRTSGAPNQPITLMAYPGERPIIDGAYQLPEPPASGWAVCNNTVSPPQCFVYDQLVSIEASYIVFDGFDVRHSNGRGIFIYNKNNRLREIVVRNTYIHDHRNAGIKMLEVDNILFENNRVWHNSDYATHDRGASVLNWSHAVNALSSTNVTYRNNEIFNNYGEGIGTGRGSSNITIENNVIYDNRALQIYIHRTQDVRVEGNLVYCTNNPDFWRGGNVPPGIIVNNESSFTQFHTVNNAQIINNVVAGCRQGVGIWGGGGNTKIGSRNVTIAYNTFVNARSNPGGNQAAAINVVNVPDHRNIRIENNIIYQNEFKVASIPSHSGIRLANNLWTQTPPATASGIGDIIGDPRLVNPNAPLVPGQVSADWFQIQPDSMAVDKGTPTEGVVTDFYGLARDGAKDIGFHEVTNR